VESRRVVLAAASVAVAYLALVPLATMLFASLRSDFLGIEGRSGWTARNYVDTFTAPGFGALVVSSFTYAVGTALLSTALGFGLAWLVTRTNTPAKSFARAAALVPLIIPGILNTVAWALLLSPHQGPLNTVLRGVGLPAFDVYSLPGMVFVQSMHVTPIAFLMGTAAFSSMDSSLEDAALASGASPLRVLRSITLRLVRPALLSAGLLIFVQTISTFEVPQLIGVPGRRFVFVSRIYAALQTYPPNYGRVGVIGMFVLSIALAGLFGSRWLNRRAATHTITGRGFRPTVADLGRWRWAGLVAVLAYFLLAVALPLAMLLWSSLLPAYQPPSRHALGQLTLENYTKLWSAPTLVRSVRNSVVTALASGAVVTALAAVVAYVVVKTRVRGRSLLDGLATVPIAVPSIVMGVGILYWYLVAPLPVHLYGTLTILVVAFVTISLPYAMRYLAPGLAQISDELEEAAHASGASWAQAFRRVYLPLLVPSLLAAFLYTVIVSFREISAAIFLYAQGTEVLSVTIFALWSNGDYPVVAALGVLMVAFLTGVVAVIRFAGGRIGLGGQ
jgi:iron(III) transport system permease protein